MKREPKLKRCPWCGTKATVEEVQKAMGIRKTVGCATQYCYGYQSFAAFDTRREAIIAWNRRSK